MTHEQLIREVHRRIGRNLILFQDIEFNLKVIAPFISSRDGTVELQLPESPDKLLRTVGSKETLGQVVRQLIDAMPLDGNAGFHAYLKYVVAERNRLAHGFINELGLGVTTIDECIASVTYLDKQLKIARPLRSFAADLSRLAFKTLVDEIDDL